MTLGNELQNKDQTQKTHKGLEEQYTMNQQINNNRTAAYGGTAVQVTGGGGGAKIHLTILDSVVF